MQLPKLGKFGDISDEELYEKVALIQLHLHNLKESIKEDVKVIEAIENLDRARAPYKAKAAVLKTNHIKIVNELKCRKLIDYTGDSNIDDLFSAL